MDNREPTTDMVKAAVQALIDGKAIPPHVLGTAYFQTWATVENAIREAMRAAPWCEHGIEDGEHCQPCNREYKRAAAVNGQ